MRHFLPAPNINISGYKRRPTQILTGDDLPDGKYAGIRETWERMTKECHDYNPSTFGKKARRYVWSVWRDDYTSFKKWSLKSGGWGAGKNLCLIDPNGNYCPRNCKWV